MASTFSPSLRLELIASGSQSGTWGVTTNNNLGDLIEQAISGATDLDVTGGNITLTALNGVTDQSRSAVLSITGTPGTTRTITIPNVSKTYTVKNRSDSTVNIKTSSGTALSVPTLAESYIYCDGDDVVTGRTITDAANAFTSNTAPLNDTALTGTPTAPTAAPGTNDTQIATTAFVTTALPVGSVIMWYGALGAIPTGWQLCNGTNGTPDMRDRFVVGAGSSYALDDTGGANSVTLTTAQLPSHNHSGSSNTVNLAHTHTFSTTSGAAGGHNHTGTTSTVDINHSHSGTTGTTGINHSHSFSATTDNVNLSHSHSGSANNVSLIGDFWVGGFNAGQSGIVSRVSVGGRPGLDNASGQQELYRVNASHSHSLSINNALGNHAHSVSGTTGANNPSHSHSFTTGTMSANATHNHSFTTSSIANHVHSVSGTTGGMSTNQSHSHTITIGNTGGGGSHENRPPYLALFFIMRV